MSQSEMTVGPDGSKTWWLNGKRHREDGPAIEWPDGTKIWFLNGKRHRIGGPAHVQAGVSESWYIDDVPHRDDGPAYQDVNGVKLWYLNGEEVTWQQVFRQAKTAEIELQILTYVLTNA